MAAGGTVSGRELAEILAGVIAADGTDFAGLSDEAGGYNPDWHCTVHGEWGDGDYACSYAEPGLSGCYGQF